MVARRNQIIAQRINVRPPLIHPVVSGSSIVTVDFDHITSRIYWADASQKKIMSSYDNGTDIREVSEMMAQMYHISGISQKQRFPNLSMMWPNLKL